MKDERSWVALSTAREHRALPMPLAMLLLLLWGTEQFEGFTIYSFPPTFHSALFFANLQPQYSRVKRKLRVFLQHFYE